MTMKCHNVQGATVNPLPCLATTPRGFVDGCIERLFFCNDAGSSDSRGTFFFCADLFFVLWSSPGPPRL